MSMFDRGPVRPLSGVHIRHAMASPATARPEQLLHLQRAAGKGVASVMAFERITAEPGKMGGRPCIRGMRVTVATVLGQLAAGLTLEQVLDDYPYLERDDVLAALEFAAAMVDYREVPLARPA